MRMPTTFLRLRAIAATALPAVVLPAIAACASRPHVVFVTGDDEYRSEISMPMLAKILEERHGMNCSIVIAKNEKTGVADPKYHNNLEGLEALREADLAVFFLRYREIPENQLFQIINYINSGRPIIAFRTTTHAFAYNSPPWNILNDGFGESVLGQKWISHHGHDSSTNVMITNPESPVMRGVQGRFHCESWLYNVLPLPANCMILAEGDAIHADGKTFGEHNPVAWTRDYNGARVFYTSLGHPADFNNESVRRMFINSIYWALKLESSIPQGGCDATPVGEWSAPPTH